MNLNITRGGWGSLADGFRLGYAVGTDYRRRKEEDALKADLASAGDVPITEEMVGEEARVKAGDIRQLQADAGNAARDAYLEANPEDGAGASEAGATAAGQYSPSLAEAERLAAKEKAGISAGGKTFDNLDDARAYAAKRRTEGMAAVYVKHGKPEQAMRLEAAGLQMRAANREDAVGAKAQGLKLGDLDQQYAMQEEAFRQKVLAQKIQGMDLMRAAGGHFADVATTNPALAEYAMKKSGFLDSFGAVDADFVPGTKDGIAFTLKDGTKAQTTLTDLKAWAKGKEPLKYTVVGEGGMLVEQDGKGGVRTVVSNPKQPDPNKNDSAMDDAAGIINSVLDANKTMMAQFGGAESQVRESAVIDHNKGIGEFKRKMNRAPTREEAAVIAEGVMRRLKAQYKLK